MDIKEKKAVIEALLFAWGEPLDIKEISKIVEIPRSEASKLIDEMIEEFDFNRRGIQIIKVENSYQLGSRHEYFDYIQKLSIPKRKDSLSAAAMETLSIIAYKQPITRIEIEDIRGVKCDKAIQTLMEKNMIREAGRLEQTGKPIIYATTTEFLKSFGFRTIKDLPILENEENLNEDGAGDLSNEDSSDK